MSTQEALPGGPQEVEVAAEEGASPGRLLAPER